MHLSLLNPMDHNQFQWNCVCDVDDSNVCSCKEAHRSYPNPWRLKRVIQQLEL